MSPFGTGGEFVGDGGGGKGGGGPGTPGNLTLRQFPFAFDTPNITDGIDTGIIVPENSLLLGYFAAPPAASIETAWDGTTPLAAVAFTDTFDTVIAQFGLGTPDVAMGGNGFGMTPSSASPAPVVRGGAGHVWLGVSSAFPRVEANCTADTGPTVPLTVVMGVNDEFVYTPVATGIPETFTVAPGVYATLADCDAAMAAAIGSGSGERFDTICSVTDNTVNIIATRLSGFAEGNGDTISFGANDVANSLGYTANPDTFVNGTGGDPGATQGSAILYLVIGTPL